MQTGSVGWTTSPTRPEIVHHYGENREIELFAPRVPATNPSSPTQVWANEDQQQHELQTRFATPAIRVQFALGRDEEWIRTTNLCEYTFDAAPFDPWLDAEGHWTTVRDEFVRSGLPFSVVRWDATRS